MEVKVMKKVVSLLLVLIMVAILAVPAFAANIAFSFNLSNNGRDYTTYKGGYNTKEIKTDPASIQCTTDAKGLGYSLHLVRKGALGFSWVVATDTYWYRGTNYTLYPSYLEGENDVNIDYYIAGRIDDDYSGPYGATGRFNSDYVPM